MASLIALTACATAPLPPHTQQPALLAAQADRPDLPVLPSCLQGATPTAVRILRVTDGDTVVLADDRRVRIIGLNALELSTSSATDQRLAVAATRALETLLADGPVYLVAGLDQFDRYGRTLAHIHLANGDNAAELLIRQGLALAVAVGRNTRCASEFLSAELIARQNGSGIWQKTGDWLIDEPRLATGTSGFRLVRSTVQSIDGQGRQRRLLLENGLVVKPGDFWPIDSAGRQMPENRLINRLVEVRGWLSRSAGTVSLSLHHPDFLRVIDH